MAVKFSQFTSETVAANVTEIVGYTATGDLNVRIPPANLDTLVTSDTAQVGTSATYTLSGTKTGTSTTTDVTTYTVPANSGMALTAGTNTIAFDATSYSLASTDSVVGNNSVPVNLTGTGGGDSGVDTVTIVGTGTVQVSSATNTITIDGSGGGGSVTSVGLTETGSALTITGSPITSSGTFNIAGAGTSSQVILGDLSLATLPTDTNTTYTVDIPAATTNINLAGSDGSNDAVTLSQGTDISLTRISASEIQIASTATGGVSSVDETTPGTSSGTPIVVNPTTGTVLVQSMAFAGAANVGHVPTSAAVAQTTHFLRADGTWQIAGGLPAKTVDQVTISNATTGTVSLSVSPSGEAYTDMYVSGVYQNKSVYSLSGSTITLDSSAYFPNGSIVEVVSTT